MLQSGGSAPEAGERAFDKPKRCRTAAIVFRRALSCVHQRGRAEARSQALQSVGRILPVRRARCSAHRIDMDCGAVQERASQFYDQRRIVANGGGERGFEGSGVIGHKICFSGDRVNNCLSVQVLNSSKSGKPAVMTGGSKIVGLWGDTPPAQAAYEAQLEEQEFSGDGLVDYHDDAEPHVSVPGIHVGAVLCLVLSLGWICFSAWVAWSDFQSGLPAAPQIAAAAAMASAPLALIGVAYMLVMRTSRREASRFANTAAAMRQEAASLESKVAQLNARLREGRAALAEQAEKLLVLGEESAGRLAAINNAMKEEAVAIDRHTAALTQSAEAARADMAVLLTSLPKAQVQTRQMAASLQEAGTSAVEQAESLEAQMATLLERGREAQVVADGAAQRLASHLGQIEAAGETANGRLDEAASRMSALVDASLARTSDALEETRRGIEAQTEAMLAAVEQSRAAIARAGAEDAESLSKRIAEIAIDVEALGARLAAHDGTGRALVAWLGNGLADIEARLAALDSDSVERTERLGDAIAALSGHADRLSSSLAAGGDSAQSLIARAETLLTALDASAREIDETLPASLGRLDLLAQASRQQVMTLAPDLGALEAAAGATIDRLAQTEKLLDQQREAITLLSTAATEQLAASRDQAASLAEFLTKADGQARGLSEHSGPQLIEVMLRVRESAEQAADRAREAMTRIVPEATRALGEASAEAIESAVAARIEAQISAITGAARQAVEAATDASQRLSAQMLTISETTAEIETRFEKGQERAEEANRETFARRVSLLIESLNSSAIDVTKILSNEVTDSAWAAYLKGDRGVFTRRAVRLLDATEARDVLRHYEDDAEFREQVNRYIHDFEAMLRTVLNSREGSPLGVTILSSDMGKLYVALAQAIERLRT